MRTVSTGMVFIVEPILSFLRGFRRQRWSVPLGLLAITPILFASPPAVAAPAKFPRLVGLEGAHEGAVQRLLTKEGRVTLRLLREAKPEPNAPPKDADANTPAGPAQHAEPDQMTLRLSSLQSDSRIANVYFDVNGEELHEWTIPRRHDRWN